MINIFEIKKSMVITILVSLCLVSCSLFIDNVLGKKPCDLCLVTRYSYLLIAIVAMFHRYPIIQKVVVILIFALLCFAFYHVGVENHWWSGPARCTTELLPTITNSTITDKVRCDVVNFSIFGVSLTVFNFIISAGLFWMMSLAIAIESIKNKNV